jgi:iron complex outermembrane receptor protein
VAGAAFASTSHAQRAAVPTGAPTAPREILWLDPVTVSGSNIARLGEKKFLPTTVIDRDALESRDASEASDFLMALPQITGSPGNETATLGATARGDNASISLRGIPSSNTLVLLNGRRLAPHPISQSEAGVPTLSVNVNQLPNGGLDHIDLLKDGASSIYGTDAIAGVVNYVTSRDFRGSELQLRYGVTNYGDGQEYRATFTHGFEFANGKGHGQVTAGHYERQAVFARDRPFSAEADNSYRAPAPWNVATDTTFNLRSATTEYGNYLLGTITATDSFGNVTGFSGARPTGVPSTLAASTGVFFLAPNGTGGAQFLTVTPSRAGSTHDYFWNNNAYRVIQPETKRTTLSSNFEYDVSLNITVFSDLSYYRAASVTYREPDGITQTTDGFIIVPATNPWNPFGTRFWSPSGAPNADGTPRLTGTPSAVSITNKRLPDLRPRTAHIADDLYRGIAGVRGRLFETWSWESAVLFSQVKVIDDEEGPSRKSLIIAAIDQTDPTKAFNPFTRTFAVEGDTLVATSENVNPKPVQSTFRSNFVRVGGTKLGSWDFRASGDLLPSWTGNPIGMAFGGELRYEEYDDTRPPFAGLNPPSSGLDPALNDFLGFSPNSDTRGARRVSATYAEVVVPLVGGKFHLPLVHALELSASARYENYSDFGDTTKPKFGAIWRPSPWMAVRTSYNRGFHAPNLAQLFTGTLIRTVTGSNDLYRSPVTGLSTDGPSDRRNVASGNSRLRPEESKGKSVGIAIDGPKLRGLTIAIDYWEIAQTGVIAASGSIADDNRALMEATQAALTAGQRIDTINLGSGTGSYQGDGSVVRLPATQADRDAFALYNSTRTGADQKAVVGAIDILRTTYFNKSSQFVNGLDFELSYRFPALPIGNFKFSTAWTKLIDFHAYNIVGAPRTELLGTNNPAVGGAAPVWRGNLELNWRRNDWGAGVSAHYVGDYCDSNATTTRSVSDSLGYPHYIIPVATGGTTIYCYRVHDSISYNANVSYQFHSKYNWISNTTLRLGVINLLNAKPPLSSDSRGYDPAVYNVLARGQSWSIQIVKKL